MNGRSKSSFLASAAIFIALEIAALAMLGSSSTIQNTWFNRMSHRTASFFWSGGQRVRSYFSLERQNGILAEENFELLQKVIEYESLLGEKAALGEVDWIVSDSLLKMVPARVIRATMDSQENHIVIDKGYEDGIEPDSGIITGRGVVGIISAVDRHRSYGLSFMNSNFILSARIGREGIIVPLQWKGTGTDRAVIREMSLHNVIEPGDTVWTSGFSDYFPADIPLGITEKTSLTFGATSEVEVRLFQDFSCLKYVTVVNYER